MADANTQVLVERTIKEIRRSRSLDAGIRAMRTRRGAFDSERAMELAGIAQVPAARQMLDDRLERYWQDTNVSFSKNSLDTVYGTVVEEVIVGGGFHAAVYAAVRARMGYARPLVIERSRPGGPFAWSRQPSFDLNSRNRPGPLGQPSGNNAQNVIIGADLQPAMVSGAEYQSNADMAFPIRVALAQYADVRLGTVLGASTGEYDDYIRFEWAYGQSSGYTLARRLIDATGMGSPKLPYLYGNVPDEQRKHMLTFGQFMARMDERFPLQGLGRVAVVGAGDSARVTVEALLGIGPAGHMSSAMLDFVPQVDWYGAGLIGDCRQWRESERTRYGRIGAFLQTPDNGARRLRVFNERVTPVFGYDEVILRDQAYDTVIWAAGFDPQPINGDEDFVTFYGSDGNTALARRADDAEIYRIGTVADLPFSDGEYDLPVARNENNRVAMFRLAPKTAALAAMLPRRF